MMRKNHGFTLIEVMIVVAVVGILATFSGSAIMQIIPDFRLKNAAAELYGDLKMAKSTAVLIKEKVRVDIDPAGWYEVRSWGADQAFDSADDVIIKTVTFADFGSGVKLGHGNAVNPKGDSFGADHITYNGNDTVFDINGMVSKPGYVYLTNNKTIMCYVIGNPTLAGVAKMAKTSGAQWDDE